MKKSMAIKKAILQLLVLATLPSTVAVCDLAGLVGLLPITYLAVISTLWFSPRCDAPSTVIGIDLLFNPPLRWVFVPPFYSAIFAVQDINLGAYDDPIPIPEEMVAQAVAENRFILMGRPVMPRRQNLRAIIASMPRVWGQSGLVHGRIVLGNQFQFIFPSEKSMETVMRRGPWAFNDRMLILQRWSPLNPPLHDFIPFWIQIREIPFQFLNRDVIGYIGRSLGNLLEVDYDAEAVARVEFVRVLVDWNVAHPLRFQRNFQFQGGVNILLRFRFERLRGFCEVCGLLTHDSGAYVLQNGGGDPDTDDEDDDMEQDVLPQVQNNPGVVIREIEEGEQNGQVEVLVPIVEALGDAAADGDDDVASIESDPNDMDDYADWEAAGGAPGMFKGELDTNELLNPIPIFNNAVGDIPGDESYVKYSAISQDNLDSSNAAFAKETGKRKRDEDQSGSEKAKLVIREKGESSGSSSKDNQCGGAVGPKPPQPP